MLMLEFTLEGVKGNPSNIKAFPHAQPGMRDSRTSVNQHGGLGMGSPLQPLEGLHKHSLLRAWEQTSR